MISSTEEEIWKQIPGYKAQASSEGRIKSFYVNPKGLIRKLQKGLRGKYLRVQFINRGPYLSVHRLVALAWHENPNNFPLVMHIDDDGLNNRPPNLKWGTQPVNAELGNKGHFSRISKLHKQVMREAFDSGFSKLSIANYFKKTDTTIRRIVMP